MSNSDVYKMIDKARVNPICMPIFDEIENEAQLLSEALEREELGDELYGVVKKWERLCLNGKQYLVEYSVGQRTIIEILEFESVDVDPDKPASLCLEALKPKRYKDRNLGDYLEWEKEVRIKPKNLLYYEVVSPEIDINDIHRYESILKFYASSVESAKT